MRYLLIYLTVINVITLFAYGADKYKARHSKWRTPEKVLLLLAALGGSIGALLGMKLFHHKTKKPKFYVGVPVLLGLQAVAGIYFWTVGGKL